MAYAPDTQHGATFAITGVSTTLGTIDIPAVTKKIPTVKSTHLGTTTQDTYMIGDLFDVDEFTVTFFNCPTSPLPVLGTEYTLTITAPLIAGGGGAENWAGKAYCTGIGSPQFQSANAALQQIQLSFKPSGTAGSTWTRTVGT